MEILVIKYNAETLMSGDTTLRRCKFIQTYSIYGTFRHKIFHDGIYKKDLTVLRTYCHGTDRQVI